jgi:hypothetical protein
MLKQYEIPRVGCAVQENSGETFCSLRVGKKDTERMKLTMNVESIAHHIDYSLH